MKWCGKSAPRTEQSGWQGKPHVEQDQIGEEGLLAPLNFRVGRWSPTVMCGLDEWLSLLWPQGYRSTETGL